MKGIEIYKIKYVPKHGRMTTNGDKDVHSIVYDSNQADASCRYLNTEAIKGIDLLAYTMLGLSEIIRPGHSPAEVIAKIQQINTEFGLPVIKSTQVPKMAKYEDLVDILNMITLRFYYTSDDKSPVYGKNSAESISQIKSKVEGSKTILQLLLKQESSKRVELKSLEEQILSEVKLIMDTMALCWKDEYPTIDKIFIYPKNNNCVVTFKTLHSINEQIQKEVSSFCSELKYKNIKKAYKQRVVVF